ncbi:hypothetical protein BJ508DRAFT_333328 [Ascobolus immersus RN42]|uniref:Uncharacterized protein n=1 Tax=Ascobolus immersus RN42 TaxID=1160509 RepID=A0A3N4HJS7_ASCIM|nr:hypothetical protein BJ508DRAFT_333328 [Ascobolus immersus RN42]
MPANAPDPFRLRPRKEKDKNFHISPIRPSHPSYHQSYADSTPQQLFWRHLPPPNSKSPSRLPKSTPSSPRPSHSSPLPLPLPLPSGAGPVSPSGVKPITTSGDDGERGEADYNGERGARLRRPDTMTNEGEADYDDGGEADYNERIR